MNKNYLKTNRESWNIRTEVHLKSDFYDVKGFVEGNNPLKTIELPLLGNVKNKTLLHLQCHFGQDTLALARMGAKVTGVDLSDKAIEAARNLAQQINVPANFICCDLYDLPKHSQEQYDIVFSSYGTINWLPDLDKWAKIVADSLKKGGSFVFAEFHPVVWMFDNNFNRIEFSYFNTKPIEEVETGTYAEFASEIVTPFVTWNHPISEVLNALIKSGLTLTSFNEYDYSPYNCFIRMIEVEQGKFRIEELGDKMPMVYSLTCTKN